MVRPNGKCRTGAGGPPSRSEPINAEARRRRAASEVAQVSNLPYRRFPIGRGLDSMRAHGIIREPRRLEALRYSRFETCATIQPRPQQFLPERRDFHN